MQSRSLGGARIKGTVAVKRKGPPRLCSPRTLLCWAQPQSHYLFSVQPWASSQRATVCVKVPSLSLWQLHAKIPLPPHLRRLARALHVNPRAKQQRCSVCSAALHARLHKNAAFSAVSQVVSRGRIDIFSKHRDNGRHKQILIQGDGGCRSTGLNLFSWFWAACRITRCGPNSSVWFCLCCRGPVGSGLGAAQTGQDQANALLSTDQWQRRGLQRLTVNQLMSNNCFIHRSVDFNRMIEEWFP